VMSAMSTTAAPPICARPIPTSSAW
jgi:hypothetical protein